jgi:hypothetical protein
MSRGASEDAYNDGVNWVDVLGLLAVEGNQYGNWDFEQNSKDSTSAVSTASSNVTIKFNTSEKCCDNVGFIQSLRQTDANGALLPFQLTTLRDRATASGTFVDRAPGYGSPWYGTKDNGTPVPPLPNGVVPFIPGAGKGTVPAVLRDIPETIAENRLTYSKWEFETCAICKEGANIGRVYGCIKWGFTITNGKVANLTPTASDLPSDEFLFAVKKWNEQAKQMFSRDRASVNQTIVPPFRNPNPQ